jgi:general L-amino acid transport system permease protein
MDRDKHIQVVTSGSIPLWRDERVIKAAVQVFSAIVVIGFLAFFVHNVLAAAEARGLGLDYDFMQRSSGIPLAESMIPYDPSNSYGYAFLVGILNTLKAAVVGIILATLVGTVTALARISGNWLLSKIATVYIEIVRNVPLLAQLFVWYFAVFQKLPAVQEAISLPGSIYLSQRGLYLPSLTPGPTLGTWAILAGVGLVLAIVLYRVLIHYQLTRGRSTYPSIAAIAVLSAFAVGGWFLVGEHSLGLDLPIPGRFNFSGGMQLTTEYAAMVTGLVFYTGAYIAEVVRAGIMAVQRGQFEAARALGLSQMQLLRLVVMPQALRVIIPPLISQYLNLTKNSSLAVAIGYADLFYVGRTIINQGRGAVPVFVMIMGTYLAMSLITSVIMNIYNRRVQLVER